MQLNTMKLKRITSNIVLTSILTLNPYSVSAYAKESSDTMEVATDVAMCVAVYKFSAGTAVDIKSKKEYSKAQQKYEERVYKTLRSASAEIQDYAFQVLVSEMQSARVKDSENGALNVLAEHQNSCSENFPLK